VESSTCTRTGTEGVEEDMEDGINIMIESSKKPTDSINSKLLLFGLSVMGGIAYLGEVVIDDWSAIYLIDSLNANALEGSLGYIAFQLFVAIGRFCSDQLHHYCSRCIILQLSGIIAGGGIALVVIAPSFPITFAKYIAIAGFGITGIGLSAVIPIVISMAGSSIRSMEPSEATQLFRFLLGIFNWTSIDRRII
jgi:fucose permease